MRVGLTLILYRLGQILCTNYRWLFVITWLKDWRMIKIGKILRLFFQIRLYLVKGSTKFWTSSAHNALKKATTQILVTAYLEMMQT